MEACGPYKAVQCLGWKAVAQGCVSPPSLWIPRAKAITLSFASPLPTTEKMYENKQTTLLKLTLSSKRALLTAVVWMRATLNPCWKPSAPSDVIRKWGLWEVTGAQVWSPHGWDWCPCKRGSARSLTPCPRKRVLAWLCWNPDCQNCGGAKFCGLWVTWYPVFRYSCLNGPPLRSFIVTLMYDICRLCVVKIIRQ